MSCVRLCFAGCVVQNSRRHGGRARTGCQNLMSIETVIHLKKSKRFLDVHLPEIKTAMRTCTPASPLSEDHLHQLRTRKIENCKKELETDFFKHGHVVGILGEHCSQHGGKGT